MRRSRSGRFQKRSRRSSRRRSRSFPAPRRARVRVRYVKAARRSSRRRSSRRHAFGVMDFAVSAIAGTVGYVVGGNLLARVPQLNTPGKRALGAAALGVGAAIAARPIARVLPVVKPSHVATAAVGAGIAGFLPVAVPILARSRVPLLGAGGSMNGRRTFVPQPTATARRSETFQQLARLSLTR